MMNRSHGGNVWQYADSSRSAIMDFSVNVNPLGMSEAVRESIVRNIDKINHYPDPEYRSLKDGLAKLHGLSCDNFIIGNGSIELIHLIPRALRAKSVLIPVPTFSEYEFAAKANDAKCLFVKSPEKDNFRLDIAGLVRQIPKADLVFLCNPNNPTGSILRRQEILELLNACRKFNATLVIDEAFMDFVSDKNRSAMDRDAAKTKNLLVLRSLTKFFVVPGIRIGYTVGHKDTISKLSHSTYPWNVNTMAQVMAEDALSDRRYVALTERVVSDERVFLYDNLSKTKGIKVYPSSANFFLCKLNGAGIKDAAELSKRLIRQGILIRSCDNFRGLGSGYFRLAVKGREANVKLISALRDILR